jgi:hypothetical protein
MNKGKVTISVNSDDNWKITVIDEKSGVVVSVISLTLENFSRAVGGLARTECEIVKHVDAADAEKIGAKRVNRTVKTAKMQTKMNQRVAIDEWLSFNKEWQLHDDGTASQQPPDCHHFMVKRYEAS